jgi:hypothetical protein
MNSTEAVISKIEWLHSSAANASPNGSNAASKHARRNMDRPTIVALIGGFPAGWK